MRISVVGLGTIGLPIAVQYATRGHQVLGVDSDRTTVGLVNKGAEPYPGETALQDRLAKVVGKGLLTATTDTTEAVATSDAVIVVVPLLVTPHGVPDFGRLDVITRDIARGLSADTLVSYETALPIGTTRDHWKPMLEGESGLTEGTDFHLVFSPERVSPGQVFADLRAYPKLVGALSSQGASRATEFYEAVLEFDERPELERGNGVWDLGSPEAAEMAKLAETTYRDVNLGLANQFGRYATQHGIDAYRVIEACNSHPHSHIQRPGAAVGGHCIPVCSQFYLWNDPDASIVRAARAANVTMPGYVVDLAIRAYGEVRDAKAVVLGAACRGGVKETAFSGVFPTVEALTEAGAAVRVHDPLYTDAELRALGFEPYALGDKADLAILQTDHEEYGALTSADLPGVSLVVDGRGVIDIEAFSDVTVLVVGKGNPNER